jgi:glycosyltransferase involved in cell wall biosynthesis
LTTAVSAYVQLNRLSNSSGVPRHMREVLSHLFLDEQIELELFVSERELIDHSSLVTRINRSLKVRTFKGNERFLRWKWGILNIPSFEQLGGESDWLYSPVDAYIPTSTCKFATTIHDLYKLEKPAPGEHKPSHYFAYARMRKVYRKIANNADLILTVSKFTADRIMALLGVPSKKIEVIHNGISESFLVPGTIEKPNYFENLESGSGSFLLNVGGLTAKKNGNTVLKMWQVLSERLPDTTLVLVGRHHSSFLQKAKTLPRVKFLSNVSDCDLVWLYQNCSCFFSLSFYEGFGIPVIEALSRRAPIVLSDIPAFREIANGNVVFIDPKDHVRAANAIEAVVKSDFPMILSPQEAEKLLGVYSWSAVSGRIAAALASH